MDQEKLRELNRILDQLEPQEAKQLLKLIVNDMGQYITRKTDYYDYMVETWESLLAAYRPSPWNPTPDTKLVHLVFGYSLAGSLKQVLKENVTEDQKIVVFNDLYAIGPLWKLHEERGAINRREWFRDHIAEYADDQDEEPASEELLCTIPTDASIVIWCGLNAHEQVGLRYAVYLLRSHSNAVYTVDAAKFCQQKYNTKEHYIEYRHAGEITPGKIQTVIEELETIRIAITAEDRQLLEAQWLELMDRREVLRIWEQGQILNVEEDYYDDYLLEKAKELLDCRGNDFIKAARVIGEAMGYCDQYIGDGFWEYRLRSLVYQGLFEIKGVPKAMRYYSVRLRSGS